MKTANHDVSRLLDREPPEVLYHYTDQHGILGILQNAEMWATHIEFLNDSEELRHCLRLAKEELKEFALSHTMQADELERMQREVDAGMRGSRMFVSSFSEDGDSLPQWRAYGGRSSGFAIGFRSKGLGDLCTRSQKRAPGQAHVSLAPCIYQPEEQRVLVRAFLAELLNAFRARLPNSAPGYTQLLQAMMEGATMHQYTPSLKHESFVDEREWRLIVNPATESFDFRAGSTLIPFVRVPFDRAKVENTIHSVVVGPTPHPDLAVRSVELLLNKLRPDAVKPEAIPVLRSKTPFRSW